MLKILLSFFDSIRDKVYYIKQANQAIILPASQLVNNNRISIPVKGIQVYSHSI